MLCSSFRLSTLALRRDGRASAPLWLCDWRRCLLAGQGARRAWRRQRMLDDGVYAPVSEIGDAENISKSYVSRILRLALLAPDIVEAIVAGRTDQSLMLETLERPLPASWEEQRQTLRCAD
jgi:hypothetical protein